MKYMLLVCGDDTADSSGMAPVEPWVEDLGERGVRRHGHRLALPSEAVTVRVRDGEVLRTDGPFAETKEYVAGFDVLECDTLEEAVQAAARHPVATVGAMEVRPFWEDEEPEARIRRLEEELTEAVRAGDVERITACYAPDATVFHDGTAHQGADTLRKALREAAFTGPVTCEVLESGVQVDESIAFGHALVRLTATGLDEFVRVTTGYRDFGLRWLITHQHVS
ncbi:YciI family protein [Streptomyces sp. S.PB5]|uniref:YciI family protein n=1 Tax=Streptomyces sp. S.PB5 TaxID=3020844 RepID=UPI0025B22480|nr:YciI family protein [Streptomyces sp. S.PB5]MDN3024190.1 YciI family protein [Streptomyces sp. S.PB5]